MSLENEMVEGSDGGLEEDQAEDRETESLMGRVEVAGLNATSANISDAADSIYSP